MSWLLGPWPMMAMAALWLVQGAAYLARRDWGHAVMALAYCVATCGLVYAWFRPPS